MKKQQNRGFSRLREAISSTASSVAEEVRTLGTAHSLRRSPRLDALPEEALALCDRAYEGLDPSRLTDYHVHVAGVGERSTGAFVHPGSQSLLNPSRYVRFVVLRRAFGLRRSAETDAAFIASLIERTSCYPSPPLHGILAFDRFHRADGTPDLAHTELYVSNGYVFGLAEKHPDLFAPIMSVHPFRPDALDALERWRAAGGRIVKWLPNVMGIDPSLAALEGYYQKMRDLGLTLLTHGGTEHAMETKDSRQELGNPQLLYRPLDQGVKVIVAHCAAAGSFPDFEHPRKKRLPAFSLFLRMMEQPRWNGLLFGEISGITLANRGPTPLEVILERPDLQQRLVNGSDYPLPGVRLAMQTGALRRWGLIDTRTRRLLELIRAVNPLLYDLVLKRVLRHPRTGAGLSAEIFHERPEIPLRADSETATGLRQAR